METSEITPEEVKARFDALKKERGWSILKIYDEGGLKIIDDYGVTLNFDTFEEFFRYARKTGRK